jgi:hypothetical protein
LSFNGINHNILRILWRAWSGFQRQQKQLSNGLRDHVDRGSAMIVSQNFIRQMDHSPIPQKQIIAKDSVMAVPFLVRHDEHRFLRRRGPF